MVRLNRPKCRPDPEEVSETAPAEEDRLCIPRRAHRELAGGVAEPTYKHPALVLLLLLPLVQDADRLRGVDQLALDQGEQGKIDDQHGSSVSLPSHGDL